MFLGAVAAASLVRYYHPETVTISTVTLEEYLDGKLVVNGSSFQWGTLDAGASYNWNYTVRNVGTVNCTVYRLVTGLGGGLTETWTGNSSLLEPQEWLVGTLTLTIPSNASGTYTWESWLIGEQS